MIDQTEKLQILSHLDIKWFINLQEISFNWFINGFIDQKSLKEFSIFSGELIVSDYFSGNSNFLYTFKM